MSPMMMTPRRRRVADLLVEGCTDKEIAARLGVSRDAAKALVRDVRLCLDAETRTAAAVKWDRQSRDVA